MNLVDGDNVKAKCADCGGLHEWVLKGPNMGLRIWMERSTAFGDCQSGRQLAKTSAIVEHKGVPV